MGRKSWLTALIFFISLSSSPATDLRGMWVVRYALSSEEEIKNLLEVAEALRITDLYVQVRALGQRFGMSPQQDKADVLSQLLKAAQDKNIRIHAWLNVLYIWSGNTAPRENSHLFYQVEQALLRSVRDDSIPLYEQLKTKGIEGYFIDPLNNRNLLDLKVIISELISNYQIKGIHLDYLRYPMLEYSFSPAGRTNFFLEHWFDPKELYLSPENFIQSYGLDSYHYVDKQYKTFLSRNLESLLQNLSEYLKNFKQEIELSIAVKPNLSIARRDYFQDWGRWLAENLCDRIVMMNYQTDYALFKENILNAKKINQDSRIVVGISTYNQDYGPVLERINFVHRSQVAGYALFSYNHLKDNNKYLDQLIHRLEFGQ